MFEWYLANPNFFIILGKIPCPNGTFQSIQKKKKLVLELEVLAFPPILNWKKN